MASSATWLAVSARAVGSSRMSARRRSASARMLLSVHVARVRSVCAMAASASRSSSVRPGVWWSASCPARRMPAAREAACPSSMVLSRCESTACHMASMLVPGASARSLPCHRRVSSASPGRASVLGLRVSSQTCLWSSARRFHPIVWPVRRSSSSMMAASRVSISLSRPLNASMSSSGTPWTSPATALVPRPRARAGSCQAQPSRWVSRSLTRLALYSLSSTVAP